MSPIKRFQTSETVNQFTQRLVISEFKKLERKSENASQCVSHAAGRGLDGVHSGQSSNKFKKHEKGEKIYQLIYYVTILYGYIGGSFASVFQAVDCELIAYSIQ